MDEITPRGAPRGQLELSEHTVVKLVSLDERESVLAVLPHSKCKGSEIWYLHSEFRSDINSWMEAINTSIDLIKRQEAKATLRGMGTVTDHFTMGDFIG
jgi:hypothetical protein